MKSKLPAGFKSQQTCPTLPGQYYFPGRQTHHCCSHLTHPHFRAFSHIPPSSRNAFLSLPTDSTLQAKHHFKIHVLTTIPHSELSQNCIYKRWCPISVVPSMLPWDHCLGCDTCSLSAKLIRAPKCTMDTMGLIGKILLHVYPGGCANGWLCSLIKPLTLLVSL